MNYAPDAFPKKCPCCGTIYSIAGWRALRPKNGYAEYNDDWDLELRDCTCGSTISVRVHKKKTP